MVWTVWCYEQIQEEEINKSALHPGSPDYAQNAQTIYPAEIWDTMVLHQYLQSTCRRGVCEGVYVRPGHTPVCVIPQADSNWDATSFASIQFSGGVRTK